MWTATPPPRDGPITPREKMRYQWNGMPSLATTLHTPGSPPMRTFTAANRTAAAASPNMLMSFDGSPLRQPHSPQGPRDHPSRSPSRQVATMRPSLTSAPTPTSRGIHTSVPLRGAPPQPQPLFYPAELGPKWIRHGGARTPQTVPVHVLLGTDPVKHIPRVPSPDWGTPPRPPMQLPPMSPPMATRRVSSPQPQLPYTERCTFTLPCETPVPPSPREHAPSQDQSVPDQCEETHHANASSHAFGSLLDWGISARVFHSVEHVPRRCSVKSKAAVHAKALRSEEHVKPAKRDLGRRASD